MPKLRHYDNFNTARFVTFSCYHRYQLLNSRAAQDCFVHQLRSIRDRYRLKLFGYVIMPEHVHLVMHPTTTLALGRVIGELKSLSARAILSSNQMVTDQERSRLRITRRGESRVAFWQPRCYDHNCRTPETVVEKINYCHNNPVKRGLVGSPADWRYSSYRWYQGVEDVPLEMDELD